MKKTILIACLALLTNACSNEGTNAAQAPKNIIMVVADGTGPAYTTAYRYYNDDPTTQAIEETVFDRHLVGMASTYPARVSGYVTDSAAAATALSTGVKSYNGAIGVDVDKKPVQTVLEYAKLSGKKTGVVVTSQINHATPASYLAHNESRKNYDAIANSYIDEGIKADVYLGGGWSYFIRDDRNLVDEFKTAGFHYVDSYDQLANVPDDKPLLGLFGNTGLPWSLDDTNPQRLSVMTKAATDQLENKKGFFMLVEASQVDWAGHSNDIAAAMGEMTDLATTMEYLEQYVKDHPDTLVVMTADHSTGGLTVAANGKYEWNPEYLRTMTQSPSAITKTLLDSEINKKLVEELLHFTITDEELVFLQQAKVEKSSDKQVYKIVKAIIDQRTNTGWTSGGHTGIDVQVFAMGAGSEMFRGKIDNTDIAKKIFSLLGK
ncbi:alkaline phosphatase [Psychrosphaera saromensis]|uniref:Alkaline phosphatase n=1 Tax=Psychrosphaera saromensis TaxID=716813 RepID=A0A2S7URH1_9GAMM|nr:alkaline phosphatase [Psychrosphaera saromensis]PQJ52543.1 alkaline phosphatase [Psychrosphaera saromensis]GHB69308.1 alkaline phosphatase [Psychrosphaera saromensis]GLQ13007.1 alkaline phosphatase [Psychrosphaera saromensis]